MVVASYTELTNLAGVPTCPVVTAFLTSVVGERARKRPIQLKNHLSQARRELAAWPRGAEQLERELKEADDLVDDQQFWLSHPHGVALVIGEDLFRIYDTDGSTGSGAFVGSCPHLLPLVSQVEEGTEFYVLALDKNGARLFRGSCATIEELDFPEFREVAALTGNEPADMQFRTINHGNATGRIAVFHGHADAERKADEHLRQFVRAVDRAAAHRVNESQAPLVFAGDAPLLPLLKESGRCSTLIEIFVPGNPESLSPKELHERAWKLIRQRNQKIRTDWTATIVRSTARVSGSTKLVSILHAANAGRVQRLAVAEQQHVWGVYNYDNQNVQILPDHRNGSEDLCNLAAAFTLRNGGEAAPVPADQLPSDSPVAAQYRY